MFLPINLDENKILKSMLGPLLTDVALLENYTLEHEEFDRRKSDGFFTFKVTYSYGEFGLIYNDFKLKGGSFGKSNSSRLIKFFEELSVRKIPAIFMLDSMGVRIMEGRTVFKNAFQTIPSILNYTANNLLITCNIGHALGLGALLFRAGHVRMAVKETSLTNLTGPEILRLFFGEKFDFEKVAGCENHQKVSLITDVFSTKIEMLEKAKALVKAHQQNSQVKGEFAQLVQPSASTLSSGTPFSLNELLTEISEEYLEIYSQISEVVKTYIIKKHNRLIGIFVNPPGNPNNLISASALDRYMLALDLFKTMKLPIISFLDTPGADPRDNLMENSDMVSKLWLTTKKIIVTPMGK